VDPVYGMVSGLQANTLRYVHTDAMSIPIADLYLPLYALGPYLLECDPYAAPHYMDGLSLGGDQVSGLHV
jgi:hypothetical protein